jgi:hypothetical protein
MAITLGNTAQILNQQMQVSAQLQQTRDNLLKDVLLYSNLTSKSKADQLSLLRNLETKSGNILEIIYGLDKVITSIDLNTWKLPLYMKYDSTINYTNFIHPTGINPTSFAIKIYSYIDIPSDGLYNFTNQSGLVNLLLNGFNILDSNNKTNDVFLKKGTYLLYIEAASSNTINLTLNLKTSTITSIDSFISKTNSYKLLTSVTNKRDNSIITFCDSITNLFTSGNVCNDSLISNTLLNNKVQTACFNRGNNQDSLFTEIKDGKTLFNSNCKKIINDSTINKTISDKAKENYNKWANLVVKNNNITSNQDRLEEYLNIIQPNEETFTLQNNIISYCETNSKDSYNIPTNDTLCNTIYNRSYNIQGNKDIITTSLNKIKTNYCTGNDANGKPRYENDPLCTKDITTLLNDTIKTRCTTNLNDQWCNTISNDNITSNADPFKTITEKRNESIKNQITSSTIDQTKPLLDDNTYNYAIGKYNESSSKKLSEELLNQKLYDYCESKETNYPTIQNSQCKGIYTKFESDKGIQDSKKRMQESLCKLQDNILTSNPNDGNTNAYLCKDTIFNTNGENLAKFADTVTTHCTSNINSEECKTYYKDIEDKILQKYIGIPSTVVSKFSNKNEDTMMHEYQNVVLESYENNIASTEVSTESEMEESGIEESGIEESEVVPIESNLIILSESENLDTMYWILFFIFFLLIITLIYSCSCNNKKENQENIPIAIPVANK